MLPSSDGFPTGVGTRLWSFFFHLLLDLYIESLGALLHTSVGIWDMGFLLLPCVNICIITFDCHEKRVHSTASIVPYTTPYSIFIPFYIPDISYFNLHY